MGQEATNRLPYSFPKHLCHLFGSQVICPSAITALLQFFSKITFSSPSTTFPIFSSLLLNRPSCDFMLCFSIYLMGLNLIAMLWLPLFYLFLVKGNPLINLKTKDLIFKYNYLHTGQVNKSCTNRLGLALLFLRKITINGN